MNICELRSCSLFFSVVVALFFIVLILLVTCLLVFLLLMLIMRCVVSLLSVLLVNHTTYFRLSAIFTLVILVIHLPAKVFAHADRQTGS